MKRWLPAATIVVVVDQLTKAWARRALADYRVIDLPGPGALRLSYNTGVAFGQGRGWGLGPIIAALGTVIIAILVLRVARQANARRQVIVGLVIGGAVGNLIDRLVLPPGWFRGPVTDFIQLVPWFPIFNVADTAITLGGIALVIAMANESNSRADDGPNAGPNTGPNDGPDTGPDQDPDPDDAQEHETDADVNGDRESDAGRDTRRR